MARVVVFGSINLDIIVPVPRLPVSGETLLGGDALISAGGKGANQAHAARLAGVEVAMVGKVGTDGLAEPALALLKVAGVDLSRVGASGHPTGCATIWSGPGGSSTIVVSPGANSDLTSGDVPDDLLRSDTIVLMQQEVPLEENARLVRRARERGATIVLNAAPAAMPGRDTLEGVDYLIVNEIELRMICETLHVSGEDLSVGLSGALGTAVVATYGSDGVLFTDGNDILRIPAKPVDVVDTTGAGDTFAGVFAAGLARGLDVAEALDHANAAAALCCTRRGAQIAQAPWAAYAARP